MTNNSYWGLLGPGDVENTRSTLTLEVGAAVRQFNNLAVPGMGNVWFVRQLLLSLLGIYVADAARANNQKARIGNIEVANAIEAFANYLSYQKNNWQADPRLRGVNKMKLRRQEDFSFDQVRKKSFYVTQPLRMGATQALMALKLVTDDSVRFNSFCLTDAGENLVDDFIHFGMPVSREGENSPDLKKILCNWVEGTHNRLFRHESNFYKFLSPLAPLPRPLKEKVKQIILNYGPEEDRKRRKGILDWVAYLERGKRFMGWEKCPVQLDYEHWKDLRSGALFFETRNLALEVFKKLGGALADQKYLSLEKGVKLAGKQLDNLKRAAIDFCNLQHDPTENKIAARFCEECSAGHKETIKNLLKRDGQVLRLRENNIEKGVFFKTVLLRRNQETEDGENVEVPQKLRGFPYPISPRVINMAYLFMDFKGQLNEWLKK